MLELGCGPGLPSIVLANLGISEVIATDVDLIALQMVEKSAREQNLDNLKTYAMNTKVPISLRVEAIEACACGGTLSAGGGSGSTRTGPALYQNIPNPFNQTSSIRYFLPNNVGSANMVFSDANGKLISNIVLENRGEQELVINKQGLSKGVYFYTLYIDGQRFDSMKMIID